jgi:hypothetical protein
VGDGADEVESQGIPKIARVGIEAGVSAGSNAFGQEVTRGRINWAQVAISGGAGAIGGLAPNLVLGGATSGALGSLGVQLDEVGGDIGHVNAGDVVLGGVLGTFAGTAGSFLSSDAFAYSGATQYLVPSALGLFYSGLQEQRYP